MAIEKEEFESTKLNVGIYHVTTKCLIRLLSFFLIVFLDYISFGSLFLSLFYFLLLNLLTPKLYGLVTQRRDPSSSNPSKDFLVVTHS